MHDYSKFLDLMNIYKNEPTDELKNNNGWATVRHYRSNLLVEADIEILKKEDSGQDATAWRAYRQQLRDLPSTAVSPFDVVFPTKPE